MRRWRTIGDSITGTGSDGQPTTILTGLDIWHSIASETAPEFYCGSIVLMSILTTGTVCALSRFIPIAWLGIPRSPFCLGVQVAWATTTEPNFSFTIYLCPANTYNNVDPQDAATATFPASAVEQHAVPNLHPIGQPTRLWSVEPRFRHSDPDRVFHPGLFHLPTDADLR
jgi:hypothetical protein